MAVAIIVMVVIRYALGWFSEARTPAAPAIGASITEGPSGGAFLVRKAEWRWLPVLWEREHE